MAGSAVRVAAPVLVERSVTPTALLGRGEFRSSADIDAERPANRGRVVTVGQEHECFRGQCALSRLAVGLR